MKTLYLMRHAKSSWKDPSLTDHQRPLNKRGKKAAPDMGRRLKERGVLLDIIVCSDAKRALDTAAAVAASLSLPPKMIHQAAELYHASAEEILGVVYRFREKWKRAMIVGHNPGFTDVANLFHANPRFNMPTAGIIELRFDATSWRHIHRDCLVFSSFDFPKNNKGI